MKPLQPASTLTVILLVCLCLVGLLTWLGRDQHPPDFRNYPAGDERKTAFFEYLGPIIDAENGQWLKRRQRLEGLLHKPAGKRDRQWLDEQSAFFNVPADSGAEERIRLLLIHIDEIPRSLALAQAAKESAWGTSRFAMAGNNYYGQRCYSKGCGLVPGSRRPGTKFEVRAFASVRDSVVSYMNNINSHLEYAELRAYRAAQRKNGKPVSGIRAAEKITQYSERRGAYVDEIQSLIHFNQLESSIQGSGQ